MIRVELPYHLRNLARVGAEVELDLGLDSGVPEGATVTTTDVLDALEARYPMLRGTIRDHASKERRAYLRYFACGEDRSFAPSDEALPEAVQRGEEPFMVVGAISGG